MKQQLYKLKIVLGFLGYSIFKNMPNLPGTNIAGAFRLFFARLILKSCGNETAVEKGANFSRRVTLGDFSAIGINAWLKGEISIGNYVLMGPNVTILTQNHKFSRTDIPIYKQGATEEQVVIIEDDVWICQNVIILPGVRVGKGAILAAGAVITKNVEPYAIMGGNPAKVIKSRLEQSHDH